MGAAEFEGATVSTLIAFATGIVGWLAGAWRGGYKVRDITADLETKINTKSADLERKIDDKADGILRDTGETIKGIRTYAESVENKVRDLALETERNFVRRLDFQNTVDMFTRSNDNVSGAIKDLRTELKEEMGRLSNLLIEVIQGKVGPTAPHR